MLREVIFPTFFVNYSLISIKIYIQEFGTGIREVLHVSLATHVIKTAMLSVVNLCRTAAHTRSATPLASKTLTRNGFSTIVSRQLTTLSKRSSHRLGVSNVQISRISNIFKSNPMIIRLCSSSTKPKKSKAVGYWLLGCSGMVFTAVVLGGVTRLTESGLSMVTWKLLGEKMPRTEDEWQAEFDLYKQFPEFIYKNQNMTLSEFKWIWWMEYAHRTWGRAIGACTFIPAAFFWLRGYLDKPMKLRVGAYCALVAAQGLMGWYMVQSGLEDRFQGPSDVPRVSQYRLAAHLSMAFILYMGFFTGALRVLRPVGAAALATGGQQLGSLPALAHALKAMAFLTAVSGAFVAGLDAGLVYNSFPKMGDRWIPEDILALQPTAVNFTENPTTVQFDHRILGTSTVALATAIFLIARKRPLPPAVKKAAYAVGAMAWLQVSLGVATLVHFVPPHLAASHQAGSLALLTLALALTHQLKLAKYIPK